MVPSEQLAYDVVVTEFERQQRPWRVVIADDEALVRGGLQRILEHDGDISVVAEAADGVQAVELAARHEPDLVLVDIRMPGMDGIEATRRIVESSAVRVVVLTTFNEDSLLVGAVRAGASGYLLKRMPPEQIRASVRTAASGQATLAPVLVDRLLSEFAASREERSPVLDTLTERELEVLHELAAARSNAEICERLFISEGTVKTHVQSVLRKLGARDRTHAAVCAYELGLVRPGGG